MYVISPMLQSLYTTVLVHILYRKSISTGLSSETSGHSCKQILDQFEDCTMSMKNGLYWVQGMQVCYNKCVAIINY